MKKPVTARQFATNLLPERVLKWGRRAVEHVTFPADFSAKEVELFRQVEPYTMTSPERIGGLSDAVRYLIDNDVPGDIVECGVWRGGSMMTIALTLQACGKQRALHLFDTFEGMTTPSAQDVSWTGRSAEDIMTGTGRKSGRNVWCIADQSDVTHNLASTGYDMALVHLVPGRVEDTVPQAAPDKIGLLRLDTDWYESTKHELIHLYPRLVSGGVLIIDDYGYWQGARQAVDEYFETHGKRPLLVRLDATARIAIKP